MAGKWKAIRTEGIIDAEAKINPSWSSSIGFQPGGISFQLSIAPTLKQEVAPLNVSGETSSYLSELFELRLSERR